MSICFTSLHARSIFSAPGLKDALPVSFGVFGRFGHNQFQDCNASYIVACVSILELFVPKAAKDVWMPLCFVVLESHILVVYHSTILDRNKRREVCWILKVDFTSRISRELCHCAKLILHVCLISKMWMWVSLLLRKGQASCVVSCCIGLQEMSQTTWPTGRVDRSW